MAPSAFVCVPASVSDDERQTIMGYFAAGPSARSSQSVTLYDGTTISAAENLRRINLTRGSAYAGNENVDPSQRVKSDAGSGYISGGTLPEVVVKANEDDDLLSASAQSFGEFINPSRKAPYNANWQADIVRSTLESAMAQQARRNSGPVLTAANPAADAAAAIARQRSANNLAGAMGGPLVGGPMQLTRLAGLDEYQVQEAGVLGMAVQDAFGMKGAGSVFRMASARGKGISPVIGAERAYLNQRFGRTGDLDADINTRGAADIRREVDRLTTEGHTIARHGPRVAEMALDNRAMHRIDPVTGTEIDFYTGGNHAAGRNASKFTSNEAILSAERYARGTRAFADSVAVSDRQFAVEGLRLEDALGPDYRSHVFGKTRLGSTKNPSGVATIDFTDGTFTSVFRKSPTGGWNLHTMYPEPR